MIFNKKASNSIWIIGVLVLVIVFISMGVLVADDTKEKIVSFDDALLLNARQACAGYNDGERCEVLDKQNKKHQGLCLDSICRADYFPSIKFGILIDDKPLDKNEKIKIYLKKNPQEVYRTLESDKNIVTFYKLYGGFEYIIQLEEDPSKSASYFIPKVLDNEIIFVNLE
jgi:hypothetical protein